MAGGEILPPVFIMTLTKDVFSKNLIIAGSAPCLFEDYQKAQSFFDKYDIMAINMSVICFDNVKHLFSLHADRIKGFLEIGKFRTLSHIHTHSIRKAEGVENVWSFRGDYGGSSSLIACLVGLGLGYGKIILCGAPLTSERRFYDTLDYKSEVGDRATLIAWQLRKSQLKNVRSMSGRTKDLLGYPAKEWIEAE